MLIDITLKITPKMLADVQGNGKKELMGHLGTHFDVKEMRGLVSNKSFTRRI